MTFATDESLCEKCYNNPPVFEDDAQYWFEEGMKAGVIIALYGKVDEADSLCFECFKAKADQLGDEWRDRVYREARRDMLEEKDNMDRADRMNKAMSKRIKAEV